MQSADFRVLCGHNKVLDSNGSKPQYSAAFSLVAVSHWKTEERSLFRSISCFSATTGTVYNTAMVLVANFDPVNTKF